MFKKISLERTACYGHCPIYKLDIFADGKVNYFGELFVRIEGFKSWQLSAESIEKLNEVIYKYDYFNIKEQMVTMMSSDSPSCITEIKMANGRERKIKNDYGCNQWPLKLKAFENRIDKIVNSDYYVNDDE